MPYSQVELSHSALRNPCRTCRHSSPSSHSPCTSGKLVSQRHLLTLQADYKSCPRQGCLPGGWILDDPLQLSRKTQKAAALSRNQSQVMPQERLQAESSNRAEAAPGNCHPDGPGVMKIRQQREKVEFTQKDSGTLFLQGCPSTS